MRRRLLLLWTPVVLGLALILPAATVASSGFSHTTHHNDCINSDVASFKVTFTAAGTTKADRLDVYSWVTAKVHHMWTDTHDFPTRTLEWHINGKSHSVTVSRAYAAVGGKKLFISFEARYSQLTGNVYNEIHGTDLTGVTCS